MSAGVVTSPFPTQHSDAEHRNELFAAQYAIQNVTNIVAAVLGGIGAAAIVSLAVVSTRQVRRRTASSS